MVILNHLNSVVLIAPLRIMMKRAMWEQKCTAKGGNEVTS